MRSQFTFYRSFFEAISRIRKDTDRAAAYDAICRYALYGEEPDIDALSDAAAIAFLGARPNLDASRKRAESGRKGGKSERNCEANLKQTASKTEANAKGEPTSSKKEIEKEIKDDSPKESEEKGGETPPSPSKTPLTPPAKNVRFIPPSVEEVAAYCRERGNGIDPQEFVDHYTANGWVRGKTKIKDWKACVRTWEAKRRDGHGAHSEQHPAGDRGGGEKFHAKGIDLD